MINRDKQWTLPVIPTRGLVALPGTTLSIEIGRGSSLKAMKEAMASGRSILFVEQKNLMDLEPNEKGLRAVGTVMELGHVSEIENQRFKLVCEAKYRVHIVAVKDAGGYLTADFKAMRNTELSEEERLQLEVMRRELVNVYLEYSAKLGIEVRDVGRLLRRSEDAQFILFQCMTHSAVPVSFRQQILEEPNLLTGVGVAIHALRREMELFDMANTMRDQMREHIESVHRETYLREQLRMILDELGEGPESEINNFQKQAEALPLPEEDKQKVINEIARLKRIPEHSPEHQILMGWIELVLALPHGKRREEILDIERARKTLNRDHYGLERVKERILEYIAVRKLLREQGKTQRSMRSPIVCLVGPPGVGKTSIASSIAKAMNREFARISMGGMHDEAEIRGHRKTYIAASPGRIASTLRDLKSMNPVILMDEIDKLGKDYRGDPASALLEVLDPNQNYNFRDNYLEIPLDLSEVLFFTTANDVSTIPRPLLDRMELIELSGYIPEEKAEIAKRHLLAKQMEVHGVSKERFSLQPKALMKLISEYTAEAGVRQLEQAIGRLLRRVAIRLEEQHLDRLEVTPELLEEIMGRPQIFSERIDKLKEQVGCVNGLAWTAVGGTILKIEVNVVKGRGALQLTGKLGDVMQESARAAMTFIRSRAEQLGIDPEFNTGVDIHIHCPAGAVPKDGPSAGTALALALASALTGRPVSSKIGLTGELTLRGRVLPIGGLREKLTAAQRAGVKEVFIPASNEGDLQELPDKTRKALKIHLVEEVDEVFRAALGKAPVISPVELLLKKERD